MGKGTGSPERHLEGDHNGRYKALVEAAGHDSTGLDPDFYVAFHGVNGTRLTFFGDAKRNANANDGGKAYLKESIGKALLYAHSLEESIVCTRDMGNTTMHRSFPAFTLFFHQAVAKVLGVECGDGDPELDNGQIVQSVAERLRDSDSLCPVVLALDSRQFGLYRHRTDKGSGLVSEWDSSVMVAWFQRVSTIASEILSSSASNAAQQSSSS
ncbi:MAG: hypothetical protein EA398_00880 [Deltaproteobacteria bacterium]|nr:MAG: hypothetical protein EA398_00880 [Deltaproteobacteria bacterium]